ncbi:hypothetical protein ABIF74_010001 [Bradyrhizobium japonicum]
MLRLYRHSLFVLLFVGASISNGHASLFKKVTGGLVPSVPGLPDVPGLPGIPGLPGVPGIPGGLIIPPGLPVPPVNIPKCIDAVAGGAFGMGLAGAAGGLLGPEVGIATGLKPATQIVTNCLSPNGKTVAPQAPLERTEALKAPAPGVQPPTPEMLAARKPIDLILYASYECRVDWHHYCDGIDYLALLDAAGAPDKDWQVCKSLFTEKGRGGLVADPTFTPSKWYTRDPIIPANFRRLQIHIHANGNNVPPIPGLPSQGAFIRLEQVGIRLIVKDASLKERVENDCDFPPAP